MTYYVGVRAYGNGLTEDSNVEASTAATIATPLNVHASKAGSVITTTWEYTPGPRDNIEGFLVYIGTSPVPNWSIAHDNGLSGGDSGSPMEIFSHSVANHLVGTLYIAVQAYSEGLVPETSDIIYIIVNPSMPSLVTVDMVSKDTGRWASCLEVTPAGDPNLRMRIAQEEGLSTTISITDFYDNVHEITYLCGIVVSHIVNPP